jgi:hypothetical protein
VNFQVTVLKILVSYPDGFAAMADLKRDMAILATSGRTVLEFMEARTAVVPPTETVPAENRDAPIPPLRQPPERARRRRERRERRREGRERARANAS